MNVRKFLISKGTIGALFMILFYGLVMVGTYFSGYKVIPHKVKELPVAIVNQDTQSQSLKKQLKKDLPFHHVRTQYTLTQAQKKLKNRQIYMIIQIPKNFHSKIVKQEQNTNLKFWINESNPTTAVTAMENTAKLIGSSIKNKVTLASGQAIFTKSQLLTLQKQAEQEIKSNPAAAKTIQAKVQQQGKDIAKTSAALYKKAGNTVNYKIKKVNKIPSGMNHSMAPFFLSLAFYIGSMIGAMILYMTYNDFVKIIGKWKSYALAELSIILLAVIAPPLIIGLAKHLNGFDNQAFFHLWIIHSTELFAALNVNFIFTLILGQLGILINMPFMLIQVVSGAGLIPEMILPQFFKMMSKVSPCFYTIQADFNLLYGGPSYHHLLFALILLGLVSIIAHLIIVGCKTYKNFGVKQSAD
ncbi:YhgE/Pip domain-containing protein [Liquorilactobacillus uvarum]|uniref:YhgE/Pip domain-containing protein n=3 Tax=Liquorilactobacillus uvarum TaxID=303240 RepID=UPI002889A1FD|nr:ABC transporter permease [Liquorilactobacillus uvarum]